MCEGRRRRGRRRRRRLGEERGRREEEGGRRGRRRRRLGEEGGGREREEILKVFCSSAVGYKRVRMMFLISSQNINVVAWSPCGQYIAAGGVDGRVTVWDAASQKAHQRSEVINNVLTAHCSKREGKI